MSSKTMLAAAALALGAVLPAAAQTPGFAPDKACVSWKTRKRLFLFKKLEPAGLSCAVKVEAVPEKGARRLRVAVPVASFDSGEPARDKHVLEILKASVQPELVFLSKPYGAKEWADLREGRAAAIEGDLRIGGADYPVALSAAVGDGAAFGTVKTRFDAFNIPAPAVAGGLVAKVADELELGYRIPLAEVPR
ncbi:MAG: YceI family protein [Elusimicrobia bacterium]|nr:YceI family protein [Elusimicrobiota bacterium]